MLLHSERAHRHTGGADQGRGKYGGYVFTAGDQSLNRNDEFLYTLLVPDRARTLFPCFDQPDMKALYTLSLEVPMTWKAVSNTYVDKEENLPAEEGTRKLITPQADHLLRDRAPEHLPLLIRGR